MALGAPGVVAETQVPHVFEPLTPLLFWEPRKASPIQFSIVTRVFFTILRLFNGWFDELYCGVCFRKTCRACLCLMIHGVLIWCVGIWAVVYFISVRGDGPQEPSILASTSSVALFNMCGLELYHLIDPY